MDITEKRTILRPGQNAGPTQQQFEPYLGPCSIRYIGPPINLLRNEFETWMRERK